MIDIQTRNPPKLLVIGDLMIDHYLWGSCKRVSPEAPVQIINIEQESSSLGGAGNVVNNLKSLGAHVDVISIIGNCKNTNSLKQLLNKVGISNKYLKTEEGRYTSKKTRIIASQQQVVRYDVESKEDISEKSENYIFNTFKKIIKNYDVVLLSDYGKGVLTSALTQSIINLSNALNIKVLVDPKGKDYSKYKNAFLLTPNKKEASDATQINIDDNDSLNKAIKKLRTTLNLNISLITLSEKGVAIYDENMRIKPTQSREVFDVTGAGDTVIAAIGYALGCKYDIDSAVEFANLAAGVVVGKIGSATTSINEIIEYESSLNKSLSNEHIKTKERIVEIARELKARGKKIIFTNGCFDILHTGHIRYLEQSKQYGDVLILGLNSDKSVNTLKGKNRPINSEKDRAYLLASIGVVDYVVIFDEETPYELIKSIKPNTLVKGSDYKINEVIGRDLVDEVKLIDFVKGKSTSTTIEKILKNQ